MMSQTQESEFDRDMAQAALRMGLRAVARQPAVLSRWRDELSAEEASTGPDLAWISGAESMAMLAAMPLEARHDMLAKIGLTEVEQTLLHPIVDQLEEETQETASRLLLSLPCSASIGKLLIMDPLVAPQQGDQSVATEPILNDADKILRLQEERRTMAKISDTGIHALALFRMAVARLSMKQTDPASLREILGNIRQSFDMLIQIDRVDGIAFVGELLGQILDVRGEKQEAMAVLEKSEAAFRLIQMEEKAQQVHEMIQQIQSR